MTQDADNKWELSKLDTAYIIEELYLRGVSISDIFGRYLEFEIAGNGRTMTVDDANHAGMNPVKGPEDF